MQSRKTEDKDLLYSSDPEKLLRASRKQWKQNMADQQKQQDTTPQNTDDDSNNESIANPTVEIPDFYIPDLKNTKLKDAVKAGMTLNN